MSFFLLFGPKSEENSGFVWVIKKQIAENEGKNSPSSQSESFCITIFRKNRNTKRKLLPQNAK